MQTFQKILIANRGEIAIRIMRAANEMGKRTVAVYAEEDKLSLHRFKADEAYRIGAGLGPVKAYLAIEDILRVARSSGADAIHPGYGLLSENPEFADRCRAEGIVFIGPKPETMRQLGDKVSARNIATAAGVPVVPASEALSEDDASIQAEAAKIGYPVMLKASWGGGGRGMRPIMDESELLNKVREGRREAEAAFGNGEVYLEKLVERARHVEVQVLGDKYSTLVHLFERDCTVQRRNQKVVERAPAPYLNDARRTELCQLGLSIMRHVNYECAGTVEFLEDVDTGAFYFIEVNPRVQVEHTVTEQATGIDIVKAQIAIAEGGHIGNVDETGVPAQENIYLHGHALQCRITTEDPLNKFIPDYGRISAYRGATGFGIRLDGGTAYAGAVITRYYDSLLEKITAWGPTPDDVAARMRRALGEFRIRGVATNLAFLENLIAHPNFVSANYTTKFIDTTPELFTFARRRDRATRLLTYISEITVNGHPDVQGRAVPAMFKAPVLPETPAVVPDGSKQLLDRHGPDAVRDWILKQNKVLLTDTTMRDAHQSLLATRMRTYDMLRATSVYTSQLHDLFSLECWGGATFDVSMRFLQECPWERLAELRARVPNILFQMLLRGANGVGYTSYPDNVVRGFTLHAAKSGIDVFRVFDSLNWIENMRVAIDAVRDSGKICEATICYTGDMHTSTTYTLDYYVQMAKQLADAGAHILAIKDMAGILRPDAARLLVRALKDATGLPIHLHTHDTSGIASATITAAVDAGVNIVDGAMDSFSGLTSQPNLGSINMALSATERASNVDPAAIRMCSDYWQDVRENYRAFESNLRSGASEVYLHEMPGGQFTNLKEQARSLGLADRWPDIAKTYADVNQMFGDIVKVTPSSKVVGDMALAMIAAGLTREQVEDPAVDVSFPESVIGFFRGDLGQPPNGFPKALQDKILKGQKPLAERPGASIPPLDLDHARAALTEAMDCDIDDDALWSSLMYPKVYKDYAARAKDYGPVSALPTPVFFYGMDIGQEISVDIETGKTINVRCLAVSEPDAEGMVKVFFELNGQPRMIRVKDRSVTDIQNLHVKADPANANHVASPLPGMISSVEVSAGQSVRQGDVLLTIEAMKMETAVHADHDGVIAAVVTPVGTQVDAKDLLVEYTA